MGKGEGQLHTETPKCLNFPFQYGHLKLILLLDHMGFRQTTVTATLDL